MDKDLQKLHDKVDNIATNVNTITNVLAGDNYGNDGLVRDYKVLKKAFYKQRDEFNKHKWYFTGIVTAISSLIAGVIAWIKSS